MLHCVKCRIAATTTPRIRLIQTTSPISRAPQTNRSNPSSSQYHAPRSSSSSYDRNPFQYNNQRTSRQSHFPQPKASTSNTTTLAIQQKLEQRLTEVWLRFDATMVRMGIELGVDEEAFKKLVIRFAREALGELSEEKSRKKWDLDKLRLDYLSKESSPEPLKQAIFSHFIQWSAQQPLPLPSTTSSSPSSSSVLSSNPTLSKLHQLALCTDFRYPSELYPFARQTRRKLFLHVGPTNSGKTYTALIALARAKTGVYAGPLRLLAHEVFTRFNEGTIGTEGKRVCNLLTGEEQRILDPNAALSSCTVEMFPLGRRLEVGVIDEIQMIGDAQRGTAWTNAILGCECKELHMCGEESVVDLITTLARELGEELVIKRYTRLSPLSVAKKSLGGDLSKIQRGDCFVTFSRNNIFSFKRNIEEKTGLKVAVAYGGLPPEVREEQARSFNEGKYDVLVASDAVGMGLNLKINRIIFETLHKWNGRADEVISMPQIKQIAGRAGRFGTQSASVAGLDDSTSSTPTAIGEALTFDESDMDLLREAIASPIVQVTKASLAAPFEAYRDVRTLLPSTTPFSRIYDIIASTLRTSNHYAPAPEGGKLKILDLIEGIQPLTFQERFQFGNSPVNLRDQKVVGCFSGFVKEFAKGKKILMSSWGEETGLNYALAEVGAARLASTSSPSSIPSGPSSPSSTLFTQQNLAELESYHRCLTLYLWLSYRLPNIFCDMESARPMRKEVESSIEFLLAGIKFERSGRLASRKEERERLGLEEETWRDQKGGKAPKRKKGKSGYN